MVLPKNRLSLLNLTLERFVSLKYFVTLVRRTPINITESPYS